MKKLLILILVVLSSCTFDFQADLDVTCPCVVSGIEKIPGGYEVKAKSLNNNVDRWFVFKTTHLYRINQDTIK